MRSVRDECHTAHHSACERVAAKRGAMHARLDRAHHLRVANDRRDCGGESASCVTRDGHQGAGVGAHS
eukprot:5016595-Prymnesium_polylepis.1